MHKPHKKGGKSALKNYQLKQVENDLKRERFIK
ncbi:MAG: hypothetical protein IEMM0008_0566 [bacterium]|nr:MAG: hypothetical protein IEMM0008_0566 [bacterium]